MATYRVRPPKPVAILGAVVGVAVVGFGVVNVGNKPGSHGFIFLWAAIGLAIVGFNLWAAFSPRGASSIITTDGDDPPHRFGQTVTRDDD